MAMTTYVQPGGMIDYVNSGDAKIEAGDVIVIGTKVSVAACDIAVSAVGTLALEGVFEFPKATGAITLGAEVYWDASAKKITTTSSSNTKAGICVKAAASADTTVRVLLK